MHKARHHGAQSRALRSIKKGITVHKAGHYGAQRRALRCTKQGITAHLAGIMVHKARYYGAQSKVLWCTKEGIMVHKRGHYGAQSWALRCTKLGITVHKAGHYGAQSKGNTTYSKQVNNLKMDKTLTNTVEAKTEIERCRHLSFTALYKYKQALNNLPDNQVSLMYTQHSSSYTMPNCGHLVCVTYTRWL